MVSSYLYCNSININNYSKNPIYIIFSILFCNMFIFAIVLYSFYLVREIIFTWEGYYGIVTYALQEKGKYSQI